MNIEKEVDTEKGFDKVAFGRRMNTIRKEKRMSSERLSELCDVNAVYLRHIESASRIPSLPVFVRICNNLNVSPNFLLVDNLEFSEEDTIAAVDAKLRSLSPRQLDIAVETINTLVDKLLNESEAE